MANTVIQTHYSDAEFKAMLSGLISETVKIQLSELVEQSQQKDQKYLTRKQAANMLGISLTTLHFKTVSKEIPCFRIGTSVRYRLDEIEKLSKK